MKKVAGLFAPVLVCAAVLAGCGTAATPDSPPSVTATAPADVLPGEQPRPVNVSVFARNIDGPVMVEGLGLDARGGHLEPPVDQPMLASWYNLGPRPGAKGPAVILGHVNGGGKQGIFSNLKNVVEGDRIEVRREDGTVAAFDVYRTVTIDKNDFPTAEVYQNTPGAELRLITCGGTLDRVAHRYLSNVIVFARLAQT